MGRTIYPWDEWSDGEWHTVTKGADFQCSVVSFKANLHFRARTNGYVVETHRIGDYQLRFQFQNPDK